MHLRLSRQISQMPPDTQRAYIPSVAPAAQSPWSGNVDTSAIFEATAVNIGGSKYEIVPLPVLTHAERTKIKGGDMATEGELRVAEIAAAEARTDTKIARMEGKLDLVISKLDDVREDNRATRANQWVIGLGLAVLIVAIATLFPVFFDVGLKLGDLIEKKVQTHTTSPKPSQ